MQNIFIQRKLFMNEAKNVNLKSLNQAFEIDTIPDPNLDEIETDSNESSFDADDAILKNIERANKVYDEILESIDNGSFSAALAAAAASLTNSITTAIAAKQSLYINDEKLEFQAKQLQLREEELKLKVKEIDSGKNSGNTTNNILIVDSRENILKTIREAKREKLLANDDVIDVA